MNLAFNEEQEELRAAARAFLRDHSSPEHVRSAMESELGYDPDVWKRIGQELGWTALLIPEEYGGLDLGALELVALLEETGAALLCAPYWSSVCLGTIPILLGASAEQKAEWLPGIASGDSRATLALCEATGRWDAAGIEATARSEGDGFVLSGRKRFVIDGASADLLLVAAREPGSEGEAGVSLFAVPSAGSGVSRRRLPTMDQTRPQAEVELANVSLPASACIGRPGEAWPLIEATLDRAAVGLSAEQVGGAQRCLDLAVEYAKERQQFGRPIGSFQAIKHKCADMMLRVESARSASYYAGAAAAEDREELPAVASLAQAYCSEAYFHCAAECLQIHGGVGFTWEYDVHLYFKRARSSEILLGDPAHHRERVARHVGI